jgi:alcohol dehydrogenase
MNSPPATMSAMQLIGHGDMDMLEYRSDVPVPTPAAGELLIRVGAAAVNNTDIWTREGAYNTLPGSSEAVGWQGEALHFPRIQGADIAGTVVAVGPGVSPDRIGERVVVDPVLRQDGDRLFGAGLFGSEYDGGFAEYVRSPSNNAIQVEFDISPVELATFPTAYLTAMHMLNRGRLVAGETVLVSGASGGVGSACVQLAKARGARVVAIVGRGKEPAVTELGADVIVTRVNTDMGGAVCEKLRGEKIDVFADLVGGAGFETILPLLHPEGGRYVTAGAIAGPVVELDLRVLYLNHLELIGSTIGTAKEFLDVLELVKSDKLRPLVSRTYPLRELHAAQHAFLEKKFIGKIVIDVANNTSI